MNAATAVMQFIKAMRLEEHLFAFQKAEDTALAGFQCFIFEGRYQGWVDRLIIGRLLISGDIAFIVSQDNLVVRIADEVIRVQRDLPAATRRIHHIGGDGKTGGVTAQGFDDLDTFADRCAEVPGAVDQVALIEVIGPYPHSNQIVHQTALDQGVIIDAGQQH